MAKDIKKNLPLSEEVINVLLDIGKEGIKRTFEKPSSYAAYSHLFNLDTRGIRTSKTFQRISADVASNLTKKYNSTRRSIRENDMDQDMLDRTVKKKDRLKEATVICNQLTSPSLEINTGGKKTKDIKQLPLTIHRMESKDETVYIEYSTIESLIKALEFIQESPEGESSIGKLTFTIIYLAIEDISNRTVGSFEKKVAQLLSELAEGNHRVNIDKIPELKNKGTVVKVFKDLIPVSKGNLISRVRDELKEANYLIQERKRYSKNIKFSRILSKIFPEVSGDVTDLIVNEFLDLMSHQNPNDKLDEIFDIVEGKDIQYYYNSYNNSYVDLLPTDKVPNGSEEEDLAKGASLYGSCMRYKKDYATTDLYARNPDKIKLLVLKSKYPGKIVGRALLWYPGDGYAYVDRIYTVSERCEKLFRKYITQKGFIGIHNSSSTNETAREKSNFIIKDLIIGKSIAEFPYLDSLIRIAMYLDYEGNIREAIGYRPRSMKHRLEDFAEELLISDRVTKLKFHALPIEFSAYSVANKKEELRNKYDNKKTTRFDIERHYKFNEYFNSRYNIRANNALYHINSIYGVNSKTDIDKQKNRLQKNKDNSKYGAPKQTTRLIGVEMQSLNQIKTDERLYKKLLLGDFGYSFERTDGKHICIVNKNDLYRLFGKKNVKRYKESNFLGITTYKYTGKKSSSKQHQEKEKSTGNKSKEDKGKNWMSYDKWAKAKGTTSNWTYDNGRPRVFHDNGTHRLFTEQELQNYIYDLAQPQQNAA